MRYDTPRWLAAAINRRSREVAENTRTKPRGAPAGQRVASNGVDVETRFVDIGFELGMTRRAKHSSKWSTVPDRKVRLVSAVLSVVPEETNVLNAYRTLGSSNGICNTSLQKSSKLLEN